MLQVNHLSKRFGHLEALSDVSLEIRPGTMHALVGHNGSGKSTLIKVLAGFHQPSGGQASVGGVEFKLGDPGAAKEAGLRFLHQDLALIETLNTIENVALGTHFTSGNRLINWKQERQSTEAEIEALSFRVDVSKPVGQLSLAQRTQVALARALRGIDVRRTVLVLDEPTASLPSGDVEQLFASLNLLRDRGASILIVTHHLSEVRDHTDELTVLRNGSRVLQCPTREIERDQLIEAMIGRAPRTGASTAKSEISRSESRLTVRGLRGAILNRLDLDVKGGEIVGVVGLEGSGREELNSLIAGARPRSGAVFVDGAEVGTRGVRQAMRARIAFVPAERLVMGLIFEMTVGANMTLSRLRSLTRWGLLSRFREGIEVEDWSAQVGVVAQSAKLPVGALSGGNQQKVLLARALRLRPAVLLLDNPTAGVDVEAQSEIHALIDAAAESGAAVVVTSQETEEILRLCHRILLISRGRHVETFWRSAGLSATQIDAAQLVGQA